MSNPNERTFEFRMLSRKPDGSMELSGTFNKFNQVDLLISPDDWQKLGEQAGWFKLHPPVVSKE